MKTYAVARYNDSTVFSCLYEVVLSTDRHHCKITRILVGNEEISFIKQQNDAYLWKWKHSVEDYIYPKDCVYFIDDSDTIIELKDDDAALLWFNLNY